MVTQTQPDCRSLRKRTPKRLRCRVSSGEWRVGVAGVALRPISLRPLTFHNPSMRSGKAATSSLIAAIVLALLTGGVFWVLQDYGPESALRKFHRSAINREWRELEGVVMPGSYRQNVELLASMVDTYARLGARYRLNSVKRQNGKVQ